MTVREASRANLPRHKPAFEAAQGMAVEADDFRGSDHCRLDPEQMVVVVVVAEGEGGWRAGKVPTLADPATHRPSRAGQSRLWPATPKPPNSKSTISIVG